VIVVDVNVIAYFWLRGPHIALAERLMSFDPVWAAPVLWRSEFRNVVAGMLRRGMHDVSTLQRLVSDAEAHMMQYSVSSNAVLDAVAASRCTAYDCEYVVLARELRVPLATTDRQVLQAFPDTAWHPERLVAR
jgi:predicted nucleic acid-binding protein